VAFDRTWLQESVGFTEAVKLVGNELGAGLIAEREEDGFATWS